jgi:archaemetzincin
MKQRSVAIVPLGEAPQDVLGWVSSKLETVLSCDVRLGDRVPLSSAWYNTVRRQYRGPELLRALQRTPREAQDRVLGLADVDCYAPGLNFVFGQAVPCASVAFVALPRLRQSLTECRRILGCFANVC